MQIWKEYDKRAKRQIWRARFRYNGKQFRPKHSTKEDLLTLIAEIRKQEKPEKDNKKYGTNIEIVKYVPTLAQLFDKFLPTIKKHSQKVLSERVFNNFLDLLPPLIKVDEFKKSHFQLYVNFRSAHLGKQSKKPIKKQTIYKELFTVRSAFKQAGVFYDSLEDWQMPALPETPRGFNKKARRERLVSETELKLIIDELMKPPSGKQTFSHHFHRVRLAHQIEFAYWTGLRRKEISTLKFSQYDVREQALLNVNRWKTDTITKFFPLAKRAVEIIESRRPLQNDCEYIFTPDGMPVASSYRTLKNVCKNLKIAYGRFADGGFISHDLRHNFGTAILQESDIETARELLGHSSISQTGAYIHTNNDKLKEAVRKRDKIDYDGELLKLFNAVKRGEIDERNFTQDIKKLFGL